MRENLIKVLQKFFNSPFRYKDAMNFLDKQKDFLLTPNVLNKTEEHEYNALWDTVLNLEKSFSYAKEPNLVMATRLSVLLIFDNNFKERKAY